MTLMELNKHVQFKHPPEVKMFLVHGKKNQKVKCPIPTQKSAKNQKEAQDKDKHNGNGNGAPQNIPNRYAQTVHNFPQYPVHPMFPNVIPPYPIYHPPNQSFPMYPQ